MSQSSGDYQRLRRSYSRISDVAPVPNLIELQKTSYDLFLQQKVDPAKREATGLEGILRGIFPIQDTSGRSQLEYVQYVLEEPKYDLIEARQKGGTYASALRVTFRLVVWDVDEETGARSIRHIKEQDVYMGDMPLMTVNGTFMINGIERVIVSQMHRSPGVFFDHDKGRVHASGKFLFAARVIPYRGSWLDLEFDAKDLLFVRIDRKRKFPVSTLLMALDSAETAQKRAEGHHFGVGEARGMDREEMLHRFYETVTYVSRGDQWETDFIPSAWRGVKLVRPLVNAETGAVVAEVGTKVVARLLAQFQRENLKRIFVPQEEIIGRYLALDCVNLETGEIYAEAGDEITPQVLSTLLAQGMETLSVLNIDHVTVGSYLRDTLLADKNSTRDEALLDIFRILRPGEPPTVDAAESLFWGLFFDPEKYDLSTVGRVKMNARLGEETPDSLRTLRKEDILGIVRVLLELRDGRNAIDDIDSLSNRRVRAVGELMENQYRAGLTRVERLTRERMGSIDLDTALPQDILNAKPVAAVLREFFGTSQLSQFMDQTNPLSEITHKRRISALGPGGLTRDRAGLEVRDVHPTHYGRICPVETPEGPNIGLINSLATYALVNPYGFIETPYRRVEKGHVTNEVVYLSAMQEGDYAIAQGNATLDENKNLVGDMISCRKAGDYVLAAPEEVDLIDVSPKQILSVAAALIPFVENDDASRALMGANMQRQAVPLIHPQAPLIGTGMELSVARDSGALVIAQRGGVVDQVDATRIVIRTDGEPSSENSGVDIYNLMKFQKSNASTCINQKPLVHVGDIVTQGQVIGDGPATELGELALGRNVTVAFLAWNGCCFEDSIVISERLVQQDAYTSIHIEEFEVEARDTKLGSEEITGDIPGISEGAASRLDESGIVYIGASVKPGDVLVGKVTPKGDNPVTPEEKLLRAIFGEKAADMRDTSLRLPPGFSGTVVDVRVFSRRGVDKDERSIAIERAEIARLVKDRDAEKNILERNYRARLQALLVGQTLASGHAGVKAKTVLSADVLQAMPAHEWRHVTVVDEDVSSKLEALRDQLQNALTALTKRFENKVERVRRGDDLQAGVLKKVKVYVAVKRKLQPGDKMAGRHGNKGVVSRIVPVEDMPYLADGTPVDIVLNPLGLPSRMNMGQILETHLGWAAKSLGRQVSQMLMDVADGKTVGDLRASFAELYGQRADAIQALNSLSDAELISMAAHLEDGLPMATPVFEGARESEIAEALEKAGQNASGQVTLYDGRSGEPFDRQVTVGVIYMLKLHHLVDEKIHARSVGPYSLITQQPLGGKAQFGGQRLGEMEVWALEAYGAAYTLQEMLTVKSDDIVGRTLAYESIIRGDNHFECGIPESFNVLVKELRSLGLNMECAQEIVPPLLEEPL